MTVCSPETLNYKWCCGAYLQEDGLGGHVHFGRKRPHRTDEIRALDLSALALEKLGVFPAAEIGQRRAGDARRQVYGAWGDHRLQTHGYEYRTWPSWLDSPALAFLVLTLSKLAVHDPSLLQGYARDVSWSQYVKNFLSFYKFLDDDARLASLILQRGFPRHVGGDFKARWGFPMMVTADQAAPLVIPPAIEPTASEVEAVFNHLALGKPMVVTPEHPTWSPLKPPANYTMCMARAATVNFKGLGELIWDLCFERSLPITILIRERHQYTPIMVSGDLAKLIPPKYFKSENIRKGTWAGNQIALSEAACTKDAAQTKRLLTSGIFPVWSVSKVERDSFAQWKKNCPTAVKTKPKFKGVVIYTSGPIPGIKGEANEEINIENVLPQAPVTDDWEPEDDE
jgi:hypothetical protein